MFGEVDSFELRIAADAEAHGLLEPVAKDQRNDERVGRNCNNAEGLLA